MIRLTLTQMRRGAGRLTAAGIAVVVATAFITATLLAGTLINGTTERAVTASFADADVIVQSGQTPIGTADVERLRGLPEVAAAEGTVQLFGQVVAAGNRDAGLITPMPTADELNPYEWLAGAPPAPGQTVITASMAERLGVGIGDTVRVSVEVSDRKDGFTTVDAELTLAGTIADPPAIVAPVSTVLVDRPLAERWAAGNGGGSVGYGTALVVGDGVTPDALAEAVRRELADAVVRTTAEVAAERTADLTGGTAMLMGLVLAFAAVAVFVAGIVVANTFQVLVAQRRHTLALLRCVGATKAQVHRSVLLESLLLGVVASVGGIVVGLGFGQVALWALARADLGIPVPELAVPSPATIIVPFVTGVVATVLAAAAPARAATRVTPVSALRPAEDPGLRAGGGLGRLVLGTVAVGLGAIMLVGPVLLALAEPSETTMLLALAVAVLGGMVSFTGILVGAVFLVPRAVRALGAVWARLAGRGGVTVRMATMNARRNPRRTSATASALLIGVTLVTMMATGAGSARASLDAALDSYFPVDIMVTSVAEPISVAQLEAVAGADGVARAIAVPSTQAGITVTGTGRSSSPGGEPRRAWTVVGLDPADRDVLRDRDLLDGLGQDAVLVGHEVAEEMGIAAGEQIIVSALTGRGSTTGTAVVLEDAASTVVITRDAMRSLAPDAPVTDVWARLAERADPGGTVASIQNALSEVSGTGAVPHTTGAVAEREAYAQIIDTLLGIVIGLLGVAVVIAVIGVANTLSLSVIERRHEHALLRAVGMTRGQLRGTLVVEGVLVAVVGTLLGALLGLGYGWAGSAIVLSASGDLHLVVPWRHLAVCAVGAVGAGVVASVLPARSAARTPPMAALAA